MVALNKIDRCYNWKPKNDTSSYLSLMEQSSETKDDFNNKLATIKLQLNERGYNVALYW